MTAASGPLRIGQFSERVGVKPDLLRAWERRYGLLQPVRSAGGFRLYTDDDARRVTRMLEALASGLSAAEAAGAAIAGAPQGAVAAAEPPLGTAVSRLLEATARFDEDALQAVLDDTFAGFGIERAIGEVILPALRAIGRSWADGDMDVSQEHFASNVIRGRILAVSRLVGRGDGPLALLACAPGEEHDISLLAFGLLLRARGWSVVFLGADTPLETLVRTAAELHPRLTVVAVFDGELLARHASVLRKLARTAPAALAGPGASASLAKRVGAEHLDGDIVAAAAGVAG